MTSQTNKWIYVIHPSKEYKQVLTNKKSCPDCGEYRRIEKLVSMVIQPGVGIYRPHKCKACGMEINIGTGSLLVHINKNGRPYPLDRIIQPDIPLWSELRKEEE